MDALETVCGPQKPVARVIDLLAPDAVTNLRQLRDRGELASAGSTLKPATRLKVAKPA
jgi:hypothetical protein